LRLIADTNVLVRILVEDDLEQAQAARRALDAAETIAIPTPVFCELVRVLMRGYRVPRAEIVAALRTLVDSARVQADREAVELGLAVFETGGDFADGAIVREGAALGGDVLLTFDLDAKARLQVLDYPVLCPV
jgi:predicted nucleic-acid-binding protein